MIFSDSTEEARRQWKEFCGRVRKNIPDRIQRIESLERLERLKKIESIETRKINTSIEDYTRVIIPDNSVIYCDQPYKCVKGYSKSKFDHEAFYEWCTRQSVPVYISEYSMPEDLFEVVAEKTKRNTQSSTKNLLRIEKIYKPRKIEVK